jgi:NAD(P)-dependent dehydrogenase (short-subunit alcohol dehydrogenase family)
MDVTDGNSVARAIGTVIAQERRLDVIINSAGYGLAGAIENTSVAEAQQQLDVNFMGAFRVCRAVLGDMRRQGSGLIINISSLGGLFGLPFQGLYSASKFALEGLSESLRYEVRQYNIEVVLIEPGDIKTNITANRRVVAASDTSYSQTFQSVLKTIKQEECNGADPNEVAKLVCKVVETRAPRARYTVGHWSQRMSAMMKRYAPYLIFESLLASFYGVKGSATNGASYKEQRLSRGTTGSDI